MLKKAKIKLKIKIIRFLLPKLQCWGVALETDLPPEFIITKHAHNRMSERFMCSEEKIKKIAIKAWYSKDYTHHVEYRSKVKGYKNSVYRIYQGYIFVFTEKNIANLHFNQKILVTVLFTKNHFFNRWG